MRYLLDVNALVALGFLEHQFHNRVANWIDDLASKGVPELASCSITELGFIRVLAQAPGYDISVEQARILLTRLKVKKTLNFTFVVDDQEICFEVNPSPAFTFYAEANGQPIDDAVARLLAVGTAVSPPAKNLQRAALGKNRCCPK